MIGSVASSRTRQERGRPTIALLAAPVGAMHSYEKRQAWLGFEDAARAHDANLLYIGGGSLRDRSSLLYELIGTSNVDGLVVWGASVIRSGPMEAARSFFARYPRLPIVNFGWAVPGFPGLWFDTARGMHDLIAHLAVVHGFRRVACISTRCNPGADARHRCLEEALSSYGLLDPALIAGSMPEIDGRGLRPAIDYEAVAAFDDYTAIEVMDTLRARGIRVPEEVAVTGLRNGREARVVTPPLTTMHMSFREMGRRAAETVLALLAGERVPDQTYVPMQLVVRQSCGCLEPQIAEAAAGLMAPLAGGLAALATRREQILSAVAEASSSARGELPADWAGRLAGSFLDELARVAAERTSKCSDGFLRQIQGLAHRVLTEGGDAAPLHTALSVLRQQVCPYLTGRERSLAEDLCQQARVAIAQTATRFEGYRQWRTEQQAQVLRRMEGTLLVTFELDELLDLLASGLPELGFRCAYLALYEEASDPTAWAHLVLAYDERGRVDLGPAGRRFAARDLLPADILPTGQRYGLVVEALHYRDEPIGYLALDAGPLADSRLQATVYEALRLQISSAIKGVRLRQELQEAHRKAAEANRLKSVFLSMVSHELRAPLNLIVSLSERAQCEARGTRDSQVHNQALEAYHEKIHVSARHLDGLIRDVLDLAAGQVNSLDLVQEELDLGQLLREVSAVGEYLAQSKGLAWHNEIAESLPRVRGDRTRLRQVLLNLLNNAVKFTAQGQVTLHAEAGAGEVTVAVSDTGIGVPLQEQARIFDEFRQSERTTVRGYGGMGLGLAIARQIVELHQGRIGVRSQGEEGCGSTFFFALPALSAVADRVAEVAGASPQTVLIVSQQALAAEPLGSYLARQGFTVEILALEGGADVLERIWVSPPAAIVLGLEPASERGWQILRALRERPPTRDVPVFFCSLAAEQGRGSLLEIDCLAKPMGKDELGGALARYGLDGRRQRVTILIVDDDPAALEAHAQLVRAHLPGCRVLTAGDGKQALDCLRREYPDLVLLDLLMPNLDGFGVLEAMRASDLTRSIPVIVLTGQTLLEGDMERLNRGVAAILRKGVLSAQETLAQVEAALARSKRLGSETQRIVRQAMGYIHANYAETITLAGIARHVNINERYLTRCFREELGLPTMAYLSRYRIQQAKELLATGDGNITRVALTVGFSSQSYFSRVFRREEGLTPRAYLRRKRP